MTKDLALSDRAFLIAWSTSKDRMTGRREHPHLISAAVLAELWLAGLVREQKGKAEAVPPSRGVSLPTAELAPVQAAMLGRIRASKPRSWKYWVKKDAKSTRSAVLERLERSGIITLEQRPLLGIPLLRITVRDHRIVHDLVERCRRAALGSDPIKKIDPLDAALTAMVSATELNTVFTGRERRANRVRIADLATLSGPVVTALRRVIVDSHAAPAG